MTNSEKSITSIGGISVMYKDELLPLSEGASQRLFADTGKRIRKIDKKANKKL